MPLSPEARRIRARLAAHRRWKPDDGLTFDELTDQLEAEIGRCYVDDEIDKLVASAPRMTPAQAARIGTLWWAVSDKVPGPQAATPGDRAPDVNTQNGRLDERVAS